MHRDKAYVIIGLCSRLHPVCHECSAFFHDEAFAVASSVFSVQIAVACFSQLKAVLASPDHSVLA